MLRTLGKDIIILAHASEDKDSDYIIKRPDMMGYMTTQNGQNA